MVGEGRPSTSLPAVDDGVGPGFIGISVRRGCRTWMLGTSQSMTRRGRSRRGDPRSDRWREDVGTKYPACPDRLETLARKLEQAAEARHRFAVAREAQAMPGKRV